MSKLGVLRTLDQLLAKRGFKIGRVRPAQPWHWKTTITTSRKAEFTDTLVPVHGSEVPC